ncbi:hypothetical protein BAOM_0917 [Peribacillus asahii]|uniref:Uncharacterized protein n=1 Tax=Peribacillus asahii TaxID=228899 RepID=A0A3T0KMN8_9BACI|nr:hypothetical protein [Peribacillus asahii]AZV41528.1 hypothetical protein BAOM_0917 [Peribacillus asahii]
MTIFMGIRTEQFVFAAIDTRATIKNSDGPQETKEGSRKLYWLDNYNISFATIGTVLKGEYIPSIDDHLRIGSYIIDKINNNNGTRKSYKQIVNEIANVYSKTYNQQAYDGTSITMIFGCEPDGEPFLYECRSPDFTPKMVKKNIALFRGSEEQEYKTQSIEVFRKLRGCWLRRVLKKENKINLQVWSKRTFDSISNNKYVGYPLLLNIIWSNGNQQKDTISETNLSIKEEFNVKLKKLL